MTSSPNSGSGPREAEQGAVRQVQAGLPAEGGPARRLQVSFVDGIIPKKSRIENCELKFLLESIHFLDKTSGEFTRYFLLQVQHVLARADPVPERPHHLLGEDR